MLFWWYTSSGGIQNNQCLGKQRERISPLCPVPTLIDAHVPPYFQTSYSFPPSDPCYPRISLGVSAAVPSPVDNVPRFIPLIALPFLYSPVVGNSGNEYLWTTCGLAPVYGYRRYKAREREGERGSFIPDEKKESYLALVIGWALDSAVVRTRRKGVGRWRWPSFALLLEENVDGEWTFGRKIPLCRPLE